MTDAMKITIREVIEMGKVRQRLAEASARMEQAAKELEEATADAERLKGVAAEYSPDDCSYSACYARRAAHGAAFRVTGAEFSCMRAKWALNEARHADEWFTKSLQSRFHKRDNWDRAKDVGGAIVFMFVVAFFAALLYLMVHCSTIW